MGRIKNVFRIETKAAEPIQAGDLQITPYSQSVSIRLPYFSLLWNRPVKLKVDTGLDTTVVPIVDVTRMIQLSLLFGGIVVAAIIGLVGRKATRIKDRRAGP